jgi:hypothetical protein
MIRAPRCATFYAGPKAAIRGPGYSSALAQPWPPPAAQGRHV